MSKGHLVSDVDSWMFILQKFSCVMYHLACSLPVPLTATSRVLDGVSISSHGPSAHFFVAICALGLVSGYGKLGEH